MITYKNPDKQRVLFSIKKQAARVFENCSSAELLNVCEKQK